MKQHKSKVAFNLVIDEGRCEALQVMTTCTMHDLQGFALAHPDRVPFVIPALKDLVRDLADKQHEMGWCKDEDCEWKTHEHED